MNPILQTLAQLLADNMGNRITGALSDGLLLAMNQAILSQQPKPEVPLPADPPEEP